MEKSLDLQQLRLDVHKADAMRELRPHLDVGSGKRYSPTPSRRKVEEAVARYVKRFAYAHLELLLDSHPLATDIDIEAFTGTALEDAKAYANNPIVDDIADRRKVYLADINRVAYLKELGIRRSGYHDGSQPSPFDYDEDYAKWARASYVDFEAESVDLRSFGGRRAAETAERKGKPRPGDVERLKRERAELLEAYKHDTGIKADHAIYACAGRQGAHSCHKPQFLDWKAGLLQPESQSCQSLEGFLSERRLPPVARSQS